jgi:hypothetical protein
MQVVSVLSKVGLLRQSCSILSWEIWKWLEMMLHLASVKVECCEGEM